MRRTLLPFNLRSAALILIAIVGVLSLATGQALAQSSLHLTAQEVFADGPSLITADALLDLLESEPTIISLRSAADYAKGHIPGAIQMDIETLFTPDGLATIPPDKQVILVCYTGQTAGQAVAALNMLGYQASALLFGMSGWTQDPAVYVSRFDPATTPRDYPIETESNCWDCSYALQSPPSESPLRAALATLAGGADLISADELFENLHDGDEQNDPTIISLRSADDFAQGHIPGAVWMDIRTMFNPQQLAGIDPHREVVVVCYTGQTAAQAATALNMLGYQASSLLFGMSGWTQDPAVFVSRFDPATTPRDYPIETEINQSAGAFPLPAPLIQPTPTPKPTQVPQPVLVETEPQADRNCIACHTNRSIMEGLAGRQPVESDLIAGDCCASDLPTMAAWQQVYVGDEGFLQSIHNLEGCTSCHGGREDAMDRHIAHMGMVPDPTSDPDGMCGDCHKTEVTMSWTGLHLDLSGFRQALEVRGADLDDPAMQQAFDEHCYTCHASCGQCHVSRPTFTGGGLTAGHDFQLFPNISDTCQGCHGTRVAAEFTGSAAGAEPSIHWQNGMDCYDCHNVTQFHGSGTIRTDRYDGEGMPTCIECHSDIGPAKTAKNLSHDIHWETVACSVCHTAGTYKNCYGCHVGVDAENLPYYATEQSEMAFKIGRNPDPNEDYPWEYVLVRHVPVEPDTFGFYGDALLANFDDAPTWKMTTPHNVQRITPQNATCNNCHGQTELFLTQDDVRAARWEANALVMVDGAPPKTELGLEATEAEPIRQCVGVEEKASHVVPHECQPQLCTQCHPGAFEGQWDLSNPNIHTLYALVEPKGTAIICEDCHAPDGSFDWGTEGYSTSEAAALTWDEFPEAQSTSFTGEHPNWILILGAALAVLGGVPVALHRHSQDNSDNRRDQ